MYWSLIATNALLRFCWTLSFVPLHYLSSAGVLTTRFSNDAWTIILAPTIASAEIIRRALWGLLRVEWEAIKQSSDQDNKDRLFRGSDDGLEMSPMEMQTGDASYNGSPYPLVISSLTSDMKHMSNIQILTELCLYTTAFAVLGIIIAAHRGTM